MEVNPYLLFDGNCEAAFHFYAESLGGGIDAMFRYEGTPAEEHMPAELRKQIIHASMRVGDTILMGSDAPPGHYEKPGGFSVSLQVSTPEEAEHVFLTLSQAGTVSMPIQPTFFAARFGMLVDRFGIPWMINCPLAA